MQPTYYPEWATTDVTLPVAGTDNKSRPDPILREVGYDLGQQPAAEEYNWHLHNIWEWIVYLNEESLAAYSFGVDVGDASGVVDVRNNFQSIENKEVELFTLTDLTDRINLSSTYSASDVLRAENVDSIYYDGQTNIITFEAKAIDINTFAGIAFYFTVDGVRRGVNIDPVNGAETYPAPPGTIDNTFFFADSDFIQVRLNLSTGEVSTSLNDVDFGVGKTFSSITEDSEIGFGVEFTADGPDNMSMDLKFSFEHSMESTITGLSDLSFNPLDQGVGGLDSVDSRRLSTATRERAGVVKVATPEEIYTPSLADASQSVLTVKDFHKYMDTLFLGSIKEVAYDQPEANGWVLADGRAISRTTFASLFAEVGTRYGVGDGSTTFNIPDYRGMFRRGWDNGAGNDPDAGDRTDSGDGTDGDEIGTHQESDNLAHKHFIVADGSAVPINNSTSIEFAVDTGTSGQDYTLRSSNAIADLAPSAESGGDESRPTNISTKVMIFIGRV